MATWAASPISPQQRQQCTNYNPAEGGEKKDMQVWSSFSGSACMFEFLSLFVYSLQNRMRTGSMYLISHLLSTCREEELGLVPIARSSLHINILTNQVSYTHAKLSFVMLYCSYCSLHLFHNSVYLKKYHNSIKKCIALVLWYQWQYHGT